MHFLDADGLTGKDGAEVYFLTPETEATALGDDERFVVQRVEAESLGPASLVMTIESVR